MQEAVEEELRCLGFTKPEGLGHTRSGSVHPDLGFGVEIVASSPMGGTIDFRRLVLIDDLAPEPFALIPIEDLIADRMGQLASGSAPEMLGQARTLFALQPGLDREYLEKRIRPGQRINHVNFGSALAARRAVLGNPEMPRNAGKRRTPSKRALLKAIEDAGGKW